MRVQLLRGLWDLSSPTRDQTRVACIARQMLNHWITRKVPPVSFPDTILEPPSWFLVLDVCHFIDFLLKKQDLVKKQKILHKGSFQFGN